MAKHQIDTLDVLEDKTKNNLSDDEKQLIDAALYEARMRYVTVASQYI
jgi:predicted kinase